MKLSNRLTCYRILLAACFMFVLFLPGILFKILALFTFVLASLTDYWDGKIARERNEMTNFGKLMDPIADKILALSAFLAFVQMNIIPAWMVVAIITRDLLITGLRLTMPKDSQSQSARSSGKHKTVLQLASIIGVLIFLIMKETPFWDSRWTPAAHGFIFLSMLFIVFITLWSGIRYVLMEKNFFFKS